MKDLKGRVIKVGDKVAFSVRSFSGYLGIGEVVGILPATEKQPDKIKVQVEASSKYAGAKKGWIIPLGHSADRLHSPKARVDTIFVYARHGVSIDCGTEP